MSRVIHEGVFETEYMIAKAVSQSHMVRIAACDWLQIAIRAVEADNASLDLALKMCACIYQGFGSIEDTSLRATLTSKLEARWALYNQPALVVAYFLNPARQSKAPLNTSSSFTRNTNLLILAADLFMQLFPESGADDKRAVTTQLLTYMERRQPFLKGKFLMQ